MVSGWIGCVLLIYGLLWWLPHRAELAWVDSFYLHHQLLPRSWNELRQNIAHNLFGEERGFSPYLFRHTPVQFVVTALALTAWAIRRRPGAAAAQSRAVTLTLIAWLLILLGVFGNNSVCAASLLCALLSAACRADRSGTGGSARVDRDGNTTLE